MDYSEQQALRSQAYTNASQQMAGEAPPSGELREMNSMLTSLVGQLDQAGMRMMNALDRIHGPRPHAAPAAGQQLGKTGAEVSISVMADLRERMNQLGALANAFDNFASRLDSIA